MKQSKLFTKTQKEAPKDEMAKNAQLLIRGGFIYKEMSGVYSLLPLGLLVMKKIENIIRQEMELLGGIEMKTSIIQNKEIWEKTNRWSDEIVDNWFKTELKNGTQVGLSFTNEEAYSNILKQYINSYKDLPVYAYDFKSIFRNETRSKSGILRGREFYWKAMYSFSKDELEHNNFYRNINQSYQNIFKKVGLGEVTYMTFASGGVFSEFSHEFQAITDAGEDIIYIHKDRTIGNHAVNKEVYNDDTLKKLGYNKEDLTEVKAIEVGNIFSLGTRFSEPFELKYKNENGEDVFVVMGSYGIGIGRLMGTVVEILSDDKGIVWPESIAPFKVHLLSLGEDDDVKNKAAELYEILTRQNIEVLFDDRIGLSVGQKFADADLIGIPYRVVVSERSLQSGGFEVKKRVDTQSEIVPLDSLVEKIK